MLDNRTATKPLSAEALGLRPTLDRGSVLSGVFLAADAARCADHADRRVYLPRDAALRARFLRGWAKRNLRRAAAGLGGLALVLPLAGMAEAQDEGLVDLAVVEGVSGSAITEGGDLVITLDNGETLRLAQGSFSVGPDGGIFVAQPVADQILAAAMEADGAGGAGGGLAGLLGGGLALGALGAAGGGGGAGAGGAGPDTGGSGPDPAPQLAYVVDGYLSGATVFGDANNNGIQDPGETSTTTQADGSFDSSLFADGVPLVARGGVDISTGETFTGTLKAPAGSTVVTPLTTVVQTIIASDTSGTPPTPQEAAASLAASLGLQGDLLNDDPSAVAETGDLSQLQAAAKIAAVINLVSAAAPDNPDAAVDGVLAALAQDLSDGEGGDPFDDPAAIQTALAAAGQAIQVSAADLATALVAAANEIDSAEDLGGLEASQTVVQGTLTTAVTQSVGTTEGPSALSTANETPDLFDTVVPLRPQVTEFTPATDTLGNGGAENTITLSGTARAGSTITYQIGLATGTVTADETGAWSVTTNGAALLAAGTEGQVVPVITATLNGVTSGAATGVPTYVIDGAAPAALTQVALSGGDDGVISAAETSGAAFTGQTEAGAEVTFSLNGGPEVVVTAGEDGRVTVSLDGGALGALVEGSNTLSAVVRDAAGNTAATAPDFEITVDTVAPDVPGVDAVTGDNLVTALEAQAPIAVTGTGTDGDSVEIFIDGQSAGTATVSGGTWSIDIAAPADGSRTLTAVATDPAGNASASSAAVDFVVETGAPTVSIDALPVGNLANAAEIAAPVTVTGSSSNAVSVSVRVLQGTTEVVPATTATLDPDGSWSASVSLDGLEGNYIVEATVTDGVTPVTTTTPLEIDATAPGAPGLVLTDAGADGVVNSAEAASATLTVTGEANTEISVSIGGTAQTVTTDAEGVAVVALDGRLTDGDTAVTATQTDAAGNVSSEASLTIPADFGKPDAPVITLADSQIDDTEIAAVTISGSGAEGDATVRLSSDLFDADIEVTADASGNWTTAPLDLSGTADAVYTISAVVIDAAGNVSDPATADLTIDAVPDPAVAITLEDGEQEGDLVLYDAVEFAALQETTESDEGGGTVSNVPEGTAVTVRLTGTSASGDFDVTFGPDDDPGGSHFRTDASGAFTISIPDATLASFDGMTEAGSVTISAGGATLTLDLLINSQIGAEGSTVVNVGTTAVDPVADAEALVPDAGEIALLDGAVLLNGLGIATLEVAGPPGGISYNMVLVYDGDSTAPVQSFAFDGGEGGSLAALSSSLFLRDDALYVLQGNLSGSLDPLAVTQGEDPLYTLYRIPSNGLAEALPAFGTADNFDTAATAVQSFDIALGDIAPELAAATLGENDVFLPLDLSSGDSAPVVLFFREDLAAETTSEAYLVRINTFDGSVQSLPVDVSAYLDGDGVFDDFAVGSALQVDPDTGEAIRLDLLGLPTPEGYERTVSYDYVTDLGFLTLTTTGNDGQTDVMVARGGILEFLDGGETTPGNTDDDFIALGNTTGAETAVNITVTEGQATISVDRAAFLEFVGSETTVPLEFDLFWTGSVTPGEVAGYGAFTSNGAQPEGGTTEQGFGYARFSLDVDVTAFSGETGVEQLDLVTITLSGVDGTEFYGLGMNLVGEGGAPDFDGFQKVGGVDGSGAQFVVVTDSQSTSGFDIVQGFDLGAEGDVIQVFANFDHYQGTAVERIGDSAEGVTLAADTGIVIFEGLVGAEDDDVIAMAETRIDGLENQSIIAVTGDESGLFVWSLAFDATGAVTSDSILRVDSLDHTDLPDFNLNSTDIQLFLPEV
jgi:hypothetical protein